MPNANLDPIEQLRDQLYALQQLVLAQCVAFAAVDRSATDAAMLIAGGQAEALLQQGRVVAAQRLTILIEEVNKCID